MEVKPKNNMIDSLPSKMAFWAGVFVAGSVIAVIGFFILLGLMFKGVSITPDTNEKATTKSGTTAVADTVNQPTAPTQPVAAGSVDVSGLTHISGDGDITIVEYSDTECPFCKRFHETMTQVVDEYDGKVRWAYKHLPLKSLHKKAEREALALECAGEQEMFWEYTDLLFDTTPSNDGLADEELFNMADSVGLDRGQFDDCLESEKYLDVVKADSAEAQKLGGQGTPFSVIVDGEGKILETIPGALPFESVAQALDKYVN
ncbi:MAG: thioredoxin domain-containing protein [bacterium]|nr:thioredoxin domain-containing protein [bacterium]